MTVKTDLLINDYGDFNIKFVEVSMVAQYLKNQYFDFVCVVNTGFRRCPFFLSDTEIFRFSG